MRRRLGIFVGALLAVSVASTAYAQGQPGATQTPAGTPAQSTGGTSAQPTYEVGLGYQVVRAGELCFDDDDTNCADAHTYPVGFAIDGVRHFGALGIVAELGWSRDSEDVTAGLDEGSVSENLFHYAGGVRWTGHNEGRFWPYAQVLLGGITTRSSVDFDDDALDDVLGGSDTRTRFLLQPGVGATVVTGDGWGVFGQVDYRRIFLKEDEDGQSGRNDLRVFLGVRVILD
jgi:hypothetical protein